MKINLQKTNPLIIILLGFFTVTNVPAVETSGIYDEAAYVNNMETSLKELDKFYLKYTDKSLSGSEKELAKRGYIVMARQILSDRHTKLDRLNPKIGDALSHTDLLLMTHIQVMLLDMLAGEHQSVWVIGDNIE